VRFVDLGLFFVRSSRAPVTECRAYACGKATRHGKPFCSDHVLMHPYAAAVELAANPRKKRRKQAV
jgi:hypothetical protein